MPAFLPLALGAAGLLSSYADNRRYKPILESNDTTGALLDMAGAGLGGFLGGSILGGGSGIQSVDNALGLGQPAPQAIPVPAGGAGGQQHPGVNYIAPGESGGIPDGMLGAGGDLGILALLSQLAAQQQSQQQSQQQQQQQQQNPFLQLFG